MNQATRRDIFWRSARLDIGARHILAADTAGLREAADEVEQIGIKRARKACGGVSCISSHSHSQKLNNATSCVRVSRRVQAADASLLILACPDAISFETPSGPWLETCSAPDHKHVRPTQKNGSAPDIRSTLPQHDWAVSLTLQVRTGDFLAGLAMH